MDPAVEDVMSRQSVAAAASTVVPAAAAHWTSSALHCVLAAVLLVPNSVLAVLQTSVQVTLSLKWIIVLLAVVAGTAASVVRYKYLTVYSRLPEESERRQEPRLDVFLDSRNKKKDARFPNFLDGFLSAIKIFGYLDKNVFHELTRNMTTQKLDADETFMVDESRGFSIVVEGSVQIYCKVGPAAPEPELAASDEESGETLVVGGVKYQLLNTVKSGTTLSSLVSILKIFTRIFEAPGDADADADASQHAVSQRNLELHDTLAESPSLANFTLDSAAQPHVPPADRTADRTASALPSSTAQPSAAQMSVAPSSALPSLLARASTNATIAIIPAEAFARIVQKHPLSVSHIIQMIMNRLHRVTFQTAHSYLGLTAEIYQTEINLNNHAKYELPSYLRDGVIQRLNEQAGVADAAGGTSPATVTAADVHADAGIAAVADHAVPRAVPPRASGSQLSADTDDSYISMPAAGKNTKASRPSLLKSSRNNVSRNITLGSRKAANPGDLLSNVPLSRRETPHRHPVGTGASGTDDDDELFRRTFSAEEETEDSSLRTAISESIFKLLGVDAASLAVPAAAAAGLETEPGSPALASASRRASAHTSNVLQNISTLLGPASGPASGQAPLGAAASGRRFSQASSGAIWGASDDDASSLAGSTAAAAADSRHLDFDLLKEELARKLQIMLVKKDTRVVEQNQRTPGLYFVVDGLLQVSFKDAHGQEAKLYTVKPGGVAGYLGTFIGNNSFVDVTALTPAYVGYVSKDDFERFIEKYHILQLVIARNTVRFMARELLVMDLALEWVQTAAGDSLYDQGDAANGIYMVLNGRFRSVHESNPARTDFGARGGDDNTVTVLSEHGQGESLGEVEVLTASERPTSMVAVRDSETARIPRSLFEFLALSKPSIMIAVTRIVARKMKDSVARPAARPAGTFTGSTDYRTITVLPVRPGLPVAEFAHRLAGAFRACDRDVLTLDQASTLSHLGRHAFDRLAKLKQSGFFADVEERYATVIYVIDTPVSSRWTQTAISQGDCVLLLADAEAPPDVGDYERLLVKTKTTARTELILLHAERAVAPGQTARWLKHRIWVHSHHHVQMAFKGKYAAKTPHGTIAGIRSKVGSLLRDDLLRMRPTRGADAATGAAGADAASAEAPVASYKSDLMRLARLLSGNAIALVLGGGGSRGISHIGIIQALEERGIPVDMVGGTSIGAFVGGLYAKDYDFVPIYGRAKQFSGRIASFWRMLSDVTYPVTSYITGHEFNRGIWKAFGDSRIEDFWLPFFTNSTNITDSVMEVHSTGYAWRYIRASMSLAGLVPPITDNGAMLLDGGYIDNLPVAEMKSRGAATIFAVDVGSVDDRTPMDYGDSLSGLWVLFNRWNPLSRHPNVPTMAEIQMRLTYVASVNALEKAKRTPGVYYLRPPIELYSTLDFGKFEEIYRVGAAYGHMVFKEFEEKGTMPVLKGISGKQKEQHRGVAQRRNSV